MFQHIVPIDSQVRPLPYPFQGAMAISNDIELASMDYFDSLMKFLNTTDETPLGRGLGLEVTSSCFFFAANAATFSYLEGAEANAARSAASGRMDEYLTSGWFDTNHAFGDFDGVGGFTRQHAVQCYDAMARLGVTLEVFTNHGSAENVQNIGRDADYHHGDIDGDAAYHADLLGANGVRYIWTDSMITEHVGGLKGLTARLLRPPEKRLLHDTILQDGSRFRGFTRLRSTGPAAPNLSSLRHQVGQVRWSRLYASHGAIVLYQHLGILDKHGGQCRPASLEALRSQPKVYLEPFRFLKRERDESRLWVAGLRRLLAYAEMVESVRLCWDEDQKCYHVSSAKPAAVQRGTFQGLTVYTDARETLRLVHGGQELPLRQNGPDETGQRSASVPIDPLESIW